MNRHQRRDANDIDLFKEKVDEIYADYNNEVITYEQASKQIKEAYKEMTPKESI